MTSLITPGTSPAGSASSSPRRPRLQNRAITDVGPLSSPSRRNARDLGQGDRPRFNGSSVSSGSTLPDGRSLPVSPFLPLPPAPTSEEIAAMAQRDWEDDNQTPTLDSTSNASMLLQRATSGQLLPRATGAAKKKPRASGMIRSFSTPVATQSQFEEERRTFAQQSSQNSRSYVFSNGWPTARSRLPAMTPLSPMTDKMKGASSSNKGNSPHLHSPSLQFGSFFNAKKPARQPLASAEYSQNIAASLHVSPVDTLMATSPGLMVTEDGAMDVDAQDQQVKGSYFGSRDLLRPTLSAARSLTGSSGSSAEEEGPITPVAPAPSFGLSRLGSQMKHHNSNKQSSTSPPSQHQVRDDEPNPFLAPAAHTLAGLRLRGDLLADFDDGSNGLDEEDEEEDDEDSLASTASASQDGHDGSIDGAFFIHEDHLRPPPFVLEQTS